MYIHNTGEGREYLTRRARSEVTRKSICIYFSPTALVVDTQNTKKRETGVVSKTLSPLDSAYRYIVKERGIPRNNHKDHWNTSAGHGAPSSLVKTRCFGKKEWKTG